MRSTSKPHSAAPNLIRKAPPPLGSRARRGRSGFHSCREYVTGTFFGQLIRAIRAFLWLSAADLRENPPGRPQPPCFPRPKPLGDLLVDQSAQYRLWLHILVEP